MAKRKTHRDVGPARAGFTYGYQWTSAKHQPNPDLKFPIEGMSRDERRIRVYPLKLTEITKNTPFDLIIEQSEVSGSSRWHHLFLGGGQRIHPDEDTELRLRVALDWHEENGYSIQPFVQESWMPPWLLLDLSQREPPRNPAEWMDKVVREWLSQWKGVGELWWLDTRIEAQEDWDVLLFEDLGGRSDKYTVYSLDAWGNARDGYEVNNQHRVGTIEVVDGGDVIEEMMNAGYLNAEAADGCQIEDQGDYIEVLGPTIPVVMPQRSEPAGSLSEMVADELWEWGWNEGLDPDFRSENGERGQAGSTLQHIDVRMHYDYTTWQGFAKSPAEDDVERAMDDGYEIARAAFDDAGIASRNDSEIPLFRLDLDTE